VRLTLEARAALLADFEALTGLPAGADDVARLEREWVADELLFREALAAGVHLQDSAVRQRLVERMRLDITGLQPDPGEEELVNFYAEHVAWYEAEPSASFEQVYFAELPRDPKALLAELRGGRKVQGESFRYGERFSQYGRSMLRGMLGQPFVDSLWAAPLGEWSGPLPSMVGWHFVRLAERLPAARLSFDAVRDQVSRDYLADQSRAAVDHHLAGLERRYEVVIER
jgi:peptidyl-prolyl cis-trans isomerase C